MLSEQNNNSASLRNQERLDSSSSSEDHWTFDQNQLTSGQNPLTSYQNQLTSGFHGGQNGGDQNPGDIWDKMPFLLGFCDLWVDFLSRLDPKLDLKLRGNIAIINFKIWV